jgi:methionyl-tRNA formyltransferase
MKISVLCSDERHPVNRHLHDWIAEWQGAHKIDLVRKKRDLSGGDILFLISCSEILSAAERSAYRVCLVLHASDLPQGRGWSPHIWQIIGGAEEITLSLLEADNRVDNGRIWKKIRFHVPKHALWNEINKILFDAEIDLINFAVRESERVRPIEQDTGIPPSYYPRRSSSDSRIDPQQSIASQFDNIRVCDPERYPAYFELYGEKYKIMLEKIDG